MSVWFKDEYVAYSNFVFLRSLFLSFFFAALYSSGLFLLQAIATCAVFSFPATSRNSVFRFSDTIDRCPAAINVSLLLSVR